MRTGGSHNNAGLHSVLISHRVIIFSADAEPFFRLKLLKEEIKKPYFISLKKFLWEEGVHGPDESAKNLRVYPSRMFSLREEIVSAELLSSVSSKKYLCVV